MVSIDFAVSVAQSEVLVAFGAVRGLLTVAVLAHYMTLLTKYRLIGCLLEEPVGTL